MWLYSTIKSGFLIKLHFCFSLCQKRVCFSRICKKKLIESSINLLKEWNNIRGKRQLVLKTTRLVRLNERDNIEITILSFIKGKKEKKNENSTDGAFNLDYYIITSVTNHLSQHICCLFLTNYIFISIYIWKIFKN